MRLSLAHTGRRWLFLCCVLLAAAAVSYGTVRVWLADYWSRSARPEDWLRAAQLEPSNAEYWYALGRFRQLDFERADLRLAIFYYRRATASDSRSAFYWMDLADTYETAGDSLLAREAFEKAKANYPISSEVAWRYGNFLLRQGDLSRAFAEIRRSLTVEPARVTLAVTTCWRASQDIDRILNEVLPAESDIYLRALDVLVAERETSPALAVWRRLLGLNKPFELPHAVPLVDALTVQGRFAEGKQVWQEALRVGGWLPAHAESPSLVTDGGFERSLPDGGFGWRLRPLTGVSAGFDRATVHSGARALRLSFDGSANLHFAHLSQRVPVEPRTRYHFAAFLRTVDVSTDSGIRFWISDPQHTGVVHVLTENLIGDHPWTLQEAELTTGPETKLLEVALVRLPSQKFDNKLAGTVWIDDVSLARVEQVATPSKR